MARDWQSYLVRPEGTPNPHLDRRFDASGRFLPEAGNTVVAQVIPGSATEAALIWLRGELTALPFAHHFAFTEIASYHMTVFEGVIETRRTAGYWPDTLPLDASIEDATAAMTTMLRELALLPDFAIRPVEVTPFGVTLAGATAEDEAMARVWRDWLSLVLRLRTPDHNNYSFHTTLAYVRSWLPATALPQYVAAMRRLTAGFLARVKVMDLARPTFCRFADMNAFSPVANL
jgi:hypothetical protein